MAQTKKANLFVHFPSKKEVGLAYDLLTLLDGMKLNGLKVDKVNQTASVNGGAILWKVNGIPRSLNEVKTLNKKDVLRVEYSDNPSIRYQDKGIRAVINIVLKVRQNGGATHLSTLTGLNAGFFNGSLAGTYHHNKSEFAFAYTNNYRNYKEWKEDKSEEYIHNDGSSIKREQVGKPGILKYLIQSLNLSYVYQANSNTQYGLALAYSWDDSKKDIFYNMLQEGLSPYDRTINTRYEKKLPTLDLYFGKTFSNKDKLEFNLLGTYVTANNDYKLLDTSSKPLSLENLVDNKRYSMIGELVYKHTFSSLFQGSIGEQSLLSYSKNTYHSAGNYVDEQKERNHYIFAELSGSKGQFSYALGTGLKIFSIENSGQKQNTYSNHSSLSLSYSFPKDIFLRYSLSYSPNLPSLSALTMVQQQRDKLVTIKGNPSLGIEKDLAQNLFIQFKKNKLTTNLTLFHTKSFSPLFLSVRDDMKNNRFLLEHINGQSARSYGVKCQVQLNELWNCLDLSTYVNYANYKSTIREDESYTLNDLSWGIDLSAYWKQWAFQASYSKPSRSLFGDYITRGENNLASSLIWQHKSLAVYTTWNFMFQKDGATYESERIAKNLKSKGFVSITDNRNMITLGLICNLNFGKSFFKSKRSLHNHDSRNSILKAE